MYVSEVVPLQTLSIFSPLFGFEPQIAIIVVTKGTKVQHFSITNHKGFSKNMERWEAVVRRTPLR